MNLLTAVAGLGSSLLGIWVIRGRRKKGTPITWHHLLLITVLVVGGVVMALWGSISR